MDRIKSEILSRKFIKPSSPTPPHLKTHKLSLLDQLSISIHGNMTFFYPPNTVYTENIDIAASSPRHEFTSKSHLLQATLSKTLAIFHPFAGRLVDDSTVDCNDQGALFIEARIGTQLTEFLNQTNLNSVDVLLPSNDPDTMELAGDALLIVKLVGFTYGGLALSLSASHKIADMASLNLFLQAWSAIARGAKPCLPEWIGPTFLPPQDGFPSMSSTLSVPSGKFVQRRFVFSPAKITQLKAKAMENGKLKHHPSRVEVVLALIWKCAVASCKTKTGSFKPSVMFQAVNLRKQVTPPLPEGTMGNFIWPFMVVVREEQELGIPELVANLRNGLRNFCAEKANKFVGEGGYSAILHSLKERMEFFRNNKDMNVYRCSAWCKFPLYDSDFGWGKPIWHVSVNRTASNTVTLADTRSGDGVEATLTLDEDEMTIFERDQELLEFACLNTRIPVPLRHKM